LRDSKTQQNTDQFKIQNYQFKVKNCFLNFELHCWVFTVVSTQPTSIASAAISHFIDFSEIKTGLKLGC
jgi:hypothetical protein